MKTETLEIEERKTIPDLDINENLVRAQVMLPEKWLTKLRETAFEKEVSRGSLIREALRDYFKKTEKPTEPNLEAKINDEDLDAIVNHCSTFFGGFNIDGEDGFIETMKLNNLKLKDLTPEQWERIKEKIQLGYSGYFSPPTPENFAKKFEVLEPSEEQHEWLSSEIAETEEE